MHRVLVVVEVELRVVGRKDSIVCHTGGLFPKKARLGCTCRYVFRKVETAPAPVHVHILLTSASSNLPML